MITETRISTWRYAELTEELMDDLKTAAKEFAHKLYLNQEFNYYAVHWEEERWLLAVLKYPTLLKILTVAPNSVPGSV